MKNIILPIVLLAVSGASLAQETGRVISSTPIIQQVGVPRQVCTTQAVTAPGSKSGAGALMGAIAGGAMGNAVGDGGGRALATMLGLVGGAILGDKVEGGGEPQVQNVQSCNTQTFFDNRTVAYNVVYEFAGKQYSVQMPNDPGPFVKLQITPVSSAPVYESAPMPTYGQSPGTVQQIYTEQVYVVPAPRAAVRIYSYPIGVHLDDDYQRDRHGHGRGYWR